MYIRSWVGLSGHCEREYCEREYCGRALRRSPKQCSATTSSSVVEMQDTCHSLLPGTWARVSINMTCGIFLAITMSSSWISVFRVVTNPRWKRRDRRSERVYIRSVRSILPRGLRWVLNAVILARRDKASLTNSIKMNHLIASSLFDLTCFWTFRYEDMWFTASSRLTSGQ